MKSRLNFRRRAQHKDVALPNRAGGYAHARKEQGNRNKVFAVVAVVVVVMTAWLLMRPASALNYTCGLDEHTHGDGCYAQVLTCGLEESDAHQHTDACYERQLVCDKTEHVHTDACKKADDGAAKGEPANAPAAQADDDATPQAEGDPVRLYQYAGENGGTVAITVSDGTGVLTPGPDNSYDVVAGQKYTVRVAYSGDVLAKGRYYVSFATNVDLTQRGSLKFKDNQNQEIDAGEWYFQKNDDGSAWLIFDINDQLGNHSGITMTADVVCEFGYVNESIEMDGNININIKHNEDSSATKVIKWDHEWDDGASGKIYWRTEVRGNSASTIVGDQIEDTIVTPTTHYYSNEDMEKGIEIEAIRYKAEGSFVQEDREESHTWTVKKGDSGLTWSETGWVYTVPSGITCADCGEVVALGDDDWLYYLKYTSTLREKPSESFTLYENRVTCDGDAENAWVKSGGTGGGTVHKEGVYYSNPDGGTLENPYSNDRFDWTLRVFIPGARANGKLDYFWYLVDQLHVEEGTKEIEHENLLEGMQVTASTLTGDAVPIPKRGTPDAEGAEICWDAEASDKTEGDEPFVYGQQISFFSKCRCTADNCIRWSGSGCKDKDKQGYCQCWSFNEDVIIKITYSTPADFATQEYGGRGDDLDNKAYLWKKELVDTGYKGNRQDMAEAKLPIPGVFTKKQTGSPDANNGYVAEYTITLNEGMTDLAQSNKTVTIEDTMSKTLVLLAESLKVEAEDAQGEKRELVSGKDFDVRYEPDTPEGNKLSVTLKQEALGSYKYTLTYDASVRGDNEVGLTYKNDAKVEINGETFDVKGTATDVPQAVIGAERYFATLHKHDAKVGKEDSSLEGATFGLYAVNGVRLHGYTTGQDGITQVETKPTEGVILHPHVLYYVQEEKAPDGYLLDQTKHYFWFCNNTDGTSCSKEPEFGSAEYNGKCIYSVNEGVIDLEVGNEPSYELPETGGPGVQLMIVSGIALMATAGIALQRRHRRTN